jgi:putative endonuclease
VRSTGTDDAQRPAASVNHEKQTRLTRAALHFLSDHRLLGQAARFDVLTLTWPDGRREPHIDHYRQAFEAVGRGQMYS